ncbi:MAG: hypothetical protein H6Q67_2109 [Firmicutes bacterium]|nr:hypothetical protein [Bacillota bacterium]
MLILPLADRQYDGSRICHTGNNRRGSAADRHGDAVPLGSGDRCARVNRKRSEIRGAGHCPLGAGIQNDDGAVVDCCARSIGNLTQFGVF